MLYEFEPRNPDEMALEEGDIVLVSYWRFPCNIHVPSLLLKSKLLISVQIDPEAKKAPPGWLLGELNNKKGLFPANYVEKMTEEEAKSEKDGMSVSPVDSSSAVKSLAAALSMQFGSGASSISPTVVVNKNSSLTNTNVSTVVSK